MKRAVWMAGVAVGLAGAAAVAVPAMRASAPAAVAAPAPAKPKPVAKPAAAPAPDPAAYTIKRVLPIEGPMKFGEWHWDEKGVPATGKLVVTVDLEAQVMSVFRDGYEIGAAVILYGSDEKPTPTGVYPITQKKKHHISNIYGAEMPYMQRLTDDGITIHASDVRDGFATHGCVGIPTEFAKKLFATTKLGDQVIVSNGEKLSLGAAIAAADAPPSVAR